MRTLTLVLAFLLALPVNAQSGDSLTLDTLYASPALIAAMTAARADTVHAYCSPVFTRWRSTVRLDSLRLASRALNPDCGPREATVLLRPACVFSLGEFVVMRVRALYVVLVCRTGGQTQGYGIPLSKSRDPSERIAGTANP
jgi:hypothetical protein